MESVKVIRIVFGLIKNEVIYTLIPQHYYKYNFLST